MVKDIFIPRDIFPFHFFPFFVISFYLVFIFFCLFWVVSCCFGFYFFVVWLFVEGVVFYFLSFFLLFGFFSYWFVSLLLRHLEASEQVKWTKIKRYRSISSMHRESLYQYLHRLWVEIAHICRVRVKRRLCQSHTTRGQTKRCWLLCMTRPQEDLKMLARLQDIYICTLT